MFALFSAVSESGREDAIRNFSHYLHIHLGISSFEEYLNLFTELLELYGVGGEPSISLNMNQQTENICMNIRGRLQREEQIMVFLRFLELAKSGNTDRAKSLIDTIARIFEIEQAEADKFMAFIFHPSKIQPDSNDLLVIDQFDLAPENWFRHICEKKLDGEILFLRFEKLSVKL